MNKEIALQAKKALEIEMTAKGIPLKFLTFFLPQMALETAGFKSRVSTVNNFSGIKFNGHGYCFNSGIKSPEGNNYAGYSSKSLWAKDYLRIAKKDGLLLTKNYNEFLSQLQAKNYFTDTLENYKKAFYSWLPQMNKLFNDISFKEIAAGGGVIMVLIFFTFLIIKL